MAIGTATALIGSAVIGGVLSSRSQSSSARRAAAAQGDAAALAAETQLIAQERAIAEQQRQFNTIQGLLAPYVQSGQSALGQQLALTGSAGPQAQQAAIQALQQGPEFRALTQAGEEAILQNASATGGLRGGNTQSALAQFRPAVLADLINNQYARLGGLSTMGQNAAAGVGTAAGQFGQGVAGTLSSTAANIANLQQQAGAAQAGGALAQGQAQANMFGNIAGAVGTAAGMGLFGGGQPSALAPQTSPRPIARPF